MKLLIKHLTLLLSVLVLGPSLTYADETLPPLKDSQAPRSVEELWAGYDPAREPVETEVLKQWEEDEVMLRIVRYRIGIFKGQKAMMAAVYGFPKGGTKLPGLVQIHGGGQFADYQAPLTNAKRGYATISLAWAGRISAPGYQVDNSIVKLFWDGKTNDPAYKLTTDWGALDAYHAPCRNEKNAFANVSPASWTLDAVESPRNNPWFLCALGARRALTFLEQQPEVEAQKLGVYGHSMGGKITVMTAGADVRVKAAAPSCGGLSDRGSDNALYRATISDDQYLQRISCPILFLSPANDFHGHVNDLQKALAEIKSQDWRATCSPHGNHQDLAEYEVAGPLWFDQCLKRTFHFPETPSASLKLKTSDAIPLFTVKPDAAKPILAVDIYYTQQGPNEGEKEDMNNAMNRFWHHAKATHRGNVWAAELPLLTIAKPLWVYANVLYPLAESVTGAGYYYGTYTATQYNLSSKMLIASPEQLKEAGVKATDKPSLVIETFGRDWQKEWFTYDLTDIWARKTHKLYDPRWLPPAFAKLALEVRSAQTNKLVIGFDTYGTDVQLTGGKRWQRVIIYPTDFHDAAGSSILDWRGVKELRLAPKEILRGKAAETNLALGVDWQGPKPDFRNLRWLPGTKAELNARRTIKLAKAVAREGKTFLDFHYADMFTHGFKAAMNTDLDGGPLTADGRIYSHGIATHAPSEAVFFLGGKYHRLHALALAGLQASVVFQVMVDDQKVFDSGLLRGAACRPVDLPLKGVRELRLMVTDGGNGKSGDAATWLDAWVE